VSRSAHRQTATLDPFVARARLVRRVTAAAMCRMHVRRERSGRGTDSAPALLMPHAFRIVCAALLLTGCMAGPEPLQSPKTANLAGKTAFPPDLGRGEPRAETEETMMYLPTEIQTACVGLDPKFAYNSQGVEGTDNKSLHVLSDCMKTGPLAGKTIKLVGHADVRGTDPYNDRLGKRRAEAVKMYLMKTGIASERLITDTVGKMGSSPPPEDWDRRVDFELVN
jgi:outer membrane protein OmpA-like peptidoglycan-associated protein